MELKTWMKKHRYTSVSFAKHAMLSPAYIYNVLHKRSTPTLKSALLICKATDYEVDLCDIFTEEQLEKLQKKYSDIDIRTAAI